MLATVDGPVWVVAYETHYEGLLAHRLHVSPRRIGRERDWVLTHKMSGYCVPGIQFPSLAAVVAVTRWLAPLLPPLKVKMTRLARASAKAAVLYALRKEGHWRLTNRSSSGARQSVRATERGTK